MASKSKVDYYKILDISKNATEDEIKKKYRKLAKQYHPDKNKDANATEMFKNISEAYQILSDPEKRNIYDKYGHAGFDESGNENPFGAGFDPFEIFKNAFDSRFDMQQNVPNLETVIKVNLEDVYNGATIKHTLERINMCKKCNGTGTKSKKEVNCKSCNGQGEILKAMRYGNQQIIQKMKCNNCKGAGSDPNEPKCKKCNGDRYIKESVELDIEIPRGAHAKKPIIIKNEGHQIPLNEIKNKNKTRSDIYVAIIENEHSKFERGVVITERQNNKVNMADLMFELNISLIDSLRGFEYKLTHLDGRIINIKFDYICLNKEIYIIKNEGMPYVDNPNKNGDLFIRINVSKPDKEIYNEQIKPKIIKAFNTQNTRGVYSMDESYGDDNNSNEFVELIHMDDYIKNIKNNEHMKNNMFNSDEENDFDRHVPQCQQM